MKIKLEELLNITLEQDDSAYDENFWNRIIKKFGEESKRYAQLEKSQMTNKEDLKKEFTI